MALRVGLKRCEGYLASFSCLARRFLVVGNRVNSRIAPVLLEKGRWFSCPEDEAFKAECKKSLQTLIH